MSSSYQRPGSSIAYVEKRVTLHVGDVVFWLALGTSSVPHPNHFFRAVRQIS
jgi:hypothetical protein